MTHKYKKGVMVIVQVPSKARVAATVLGYTRGKGLQVQCVGDRYPRWVEDAWSTPTPKFSIGDRVRTSREGVGTVIRIVPWDEDSSRELEDACVNVYWVWLDEHWKKQGYQEKELTLLEEKKP